MQHRINTYPVSAYTPLTFAVAQTLGLKRIS